MYELKIISRFAAAHQLRNYGGECENLHGHNWRIEVCVAGQELGPDGLLMDFKEIKTATEKIVGELDHAFLNDLPPFSTVEPSSENIAHHIYRTLASELNTHEAKVSKVTAWESDTACATYSEP